MSESPDSPEGRQGGSAEPPPPAPPAPGSAGPSSPPGSTGSTGSTGPPSPPGPPTDSAFPPPPDPETILPPPALPPPEDPQNVAWGPSRVVVGLFLLLGLVLLESVPIALADPELESVAARLTLQLGLGLTMIGVALAMARQSTGTDLRLSARALGVRKPTGPVVVPVIITYVGYIACALVLAALIQPEQEDITRELGFDEGWFAALVAGILIVLLAPVAEEIFFRGFMFGGLRRGVPVAVAALISAAIWGLFHYTGPDSWGVCLQLAIFGLFLAWLYQRTGSIWPPIAVHAFNNAVAFALLTS